MMIGDILVEEGIEVNLQGRNKEEVLNELVNLLSRGFNPAEIENIRKSIFERENLSSTGICNGLAIPHAKVSGIKKIIAGVGLSKDGLDFQSMDGQPSKIFFVLISPKDDHGNHVKSLAKVTKILKNENWRNELLNCKTAREVLNFIREKEKEI